MIDAVLARTRARMAGYGGRWWVAGGWAIDGWLGEVTRPHHDVDVAVLRDDLDRLWRHLQGWQVWVNEPGRFFPWDGGPLAAGDACLLARPDDGLELSWEAFASHPDNLELMVEDADGDTWRYRRDHAVSDRLTRLGPSGGFIAPEVALLYKAPHHDVERNAADFEVARPRLGGERRRWLVRALRTAHPGHPWLTPLA